MIGASWTQPYPSHRSPVLARNAVATSQPLATQAGVAVLARGGNAVDAAIATAITLAVVEPVSNGLGSDLYAIVWDGERLEGLNASGRAPRAANLARLAGRSEAPVRGWESVTIPGAVSGWVALSKRYGRLPFADLFGPAIRYARDGYAVSPIVARQWARAAGVLPHDLGFAEHFLPGGRPPDAGRTFRCDAMAGSLEAIAATGGEAFYRGELAKSMVAHARSHGAVHALDDFAEHACDWVRPLAFDYRGTTVHEIPPNGQGIAALIALGILERLPGTDGTADSVAAQHRAIEAMKLAFADVYAQVADPQHLRVSPEAMLDRDYLARRAARFEAGRAQDFGPGSPPAGGTVYLATGDADGMMVSLIQSNYMGFGSGVVVPGTGISLQNRGAGFSLDPSHPNALAGGKRPFHTIIPGFLTRDGAPLAAFGVMGGPIQPQGHVQLLTRLLDHGMNAQAAIDAPRWRWNRDGTLDIEPTAPAEWRTGLAALGHRIAAHDDTFDFGAGQCVMRCGDGYLAASDARRDGQAAGF
ncbi:MAG: gamma-glutamyltransferase family protein [Burkholderiales bacterium]|nr:gamma-glutamyltransferase family protein [Burkholderiales bacterium]